MSNLLQLIVDHPQQTTTLVRVAVWGRGLILEFESSTILLAMAAVPAPASEFVQEAEKELQNQMHPDGVDLW